MQNLYFKYCKYKKGQPYNETEQSDLKWTEVDMRHSNPSFKTRIRTCLLSSGFMCGIKQDTKVLVSQTRASHAWYCVFLAQVLYQSSESSIFNYRNGSSSARMPMIFLTKTTCFFTAIPGNSSRSCWLSVLLVGLLASWPWFSNVMKFQVLSQVCCPMFVLVSSCHDAFTDSALCSMIQFLIAK